MIASRIVLLLALLGSALPAHAITIVGYTTTASNRWSSNPTDPLTGPFTPNTNAAFVGLPYDLSGIGWKSTNTGSWDNLSVTLISPLHLAQAAHVGDRHSNNTFTFQNTDGTLVSRSITGTASFTDIITPDSDARVVRLGSAFTPADKVAVYRFLDVGPQSNVIGYPALLYGHTGGTFPRRLGLSTVSYADDTNDHIYFNTTTPPTNHATVYVVGDSGSPSFLIYNGQLHFSGTHHYSSLADLNWASPLVYPGTNAFMAADGYALRWTIDTTKARSWTGTTNGTFGTTTNWLGGTLPSASYSAVLDAASTSNRTLSLATPATVRGLLVKAAAGTNPFTFSGSTLTLMESGLRNEDADALTINNPITLGGSQNWEAANGPLTFGADIATAGFLVVLSGDQAITLSGNLTGTGSVAWDNPGTWSPASGQLALTTGKLFVQRGTVTLATANTYSGGTVATGGTLLANNTTGSATGSGTVSVSQTAKLGGTGTISGAVTLTNGGGLTANLTTIPGSHDKLDITGALALGTTSTLTINANGTATTGTYTLITAAGGITGTLPTLTLPSGWSATAQISGNNLNLIVSSLVPAVPVITSGQTTAAIVNATFSYSLATTQTPTSFALSSGSLPSGVTLNTTTGLLSGTPTSTGVFTPVFTATNGVGTSAPVSITLTVASATGQPVRTGTYIGTSGSYNNDSTKTGAKAFDGSTSTFFDGANASGNWVGLDLGSPCAISEIRYFPRSGQEARMNGGIFQGSSTADFSSGVVNLFTISATPAFAWNTATPSSAGPFRYVRYLAPSNSYGNVAEIEFRGLVAAVPGAPSSLTASSASASQINLTWTDNANNETGFKLERSPDGSTGWTQIATPAANATTYSDTGLSAATAYYYRLRSTSTDGDSAYTASASATTYNGLQSFRSTYSLAPDGSQDTATPAGDGVPNLLKYAFNMLGSDTGQAATLATPNASVLTSGGTAGLPYVSIGTGGDAGKLQITFIRRKAASTPGITYAVEWSDALASWAINPSATASVTSLDSTFERVTITDDTATPAKRFARVKVTAP